MPPRRKIAPAKATKEAPQLPLQDEVRAALAWLESKSTQRDRENLARFAISTSKFFGVSMANMKVLAKDLGRDHELAAALWDTGWYEARMLASWWTSRPASRPPRWTAGAGTLTTGPSATRRASPCSIARRTPGEGRAVVPPAQRVRQARGLRPAGGLTVHDKALMTNLSSRPCCSWSAR